MGNVDESNNVTFIFFIIIIISLQIFIPTYLHETNLDNGLGTLFLIHETKVVRDSVQRIVHKKLKQVNPNKQTSGKFIRPKRVQNENISV